MLSQRNCQATKRAMLKTLNQSVSILLLDHFHFDRPMVVQQPGLAEKLMYITTHYLVRTRLPTLCSTQISRSGRFRMKFGRLWTLSYLENGSHDPGELDLSKQRNEQVYVIRKVSAIIYVKYINKRILLKLKNLSFPFHLTSNVTER